MTWTTKARCQGLDTEMFFEPEREDFESHDVWVQETRERLRAARQFCQACPVIEECLAQNMDATHGVFGGKSAVQRGRQAKDEGLPVEPAERRVMDAERVSTILGLRDQGMSYSDIESFTGINRGTISRVLNNPKYNTLARPAAESTYQNLRYQKNWNTPQYAAVRQLIEEGKLTSKSIAEKTGYSAKTIRRIKYSMDQGVTA